MHTTLSYKSARFLSDVIRPCFFLDPQEEFLYCPSHKKKRNITSLKDGCLLEVILKMPNGSISASGLNRNPPKADKS